MGRGLGTGDARTRGLRDVGRGDAGSRGRGDAGTPGRRDDVGDWGRDKQTAHEFFAEFVKYNFRCSRERYYTLESLSVD